MVAETVISDVEEKIKTNLTVWEDLLNWPARNQDFLVEHFLNFAFASIIFIFSILLSKFAAKSLTKILNAKNVDKTICVFVTKMLRYFIIGLGTLTSLNYLGIETTSFIALIGAAGLAVGLALQGALSNFAAGILIVMLRPFKAGEYIATSGIEGTINSVDIFSTSFVTFDNKFVIVPNASILSSNITNYSRKATRRIDLVVGVSYDANIKEVKTILENAIKVTAKILPAPEPQIAVAELGDSSVNFIARPWVKSDDYWTVRFALIEQIKISLDEAGISIPFPQMDVHLNNK